MEHVVGFLDALQAPAQPGKKDLPEKVVGAHTISISDEAYTLVCQLRRGDETDSDVVERAIGWADAYSIAVRALRSKLVRKAGMVVRDIRKVGYSEDVAAALCRAFFGDQSEKDLRNAFSLLDVDESGFIDKEEFQTALPRMGEDIKEDRVDELFDLVDKDKSGLIDFEEFAMLIRGLNPSPNADEVGNAFQQFRSNAEGGLDIFSDVVGSAATGAALSVSSTWSAISTAWDADLKGINPLDMRKAGVVLKNMKEAGYDDSKAQAVCRALFCDQSEKQLKRVFKYFDADRSGFLEAEELIEAFRLMGENVQEEDVTTKFLKVGVEVGDKVNFSTFCRLVRRMNPRRERKKRDSVVGSAWSTVTNKWQEKTRLHGSVFSIDAAEAEPAPETQADIAETAHSASSSGTLSAGYASHMSTAASAPKAQPKMKVQLHRPVPSMPPGGMPMF